MQENLTFQNIILRHFNDPQNQSLASEVNVLRAQSDENEKYFQELKSIWERSAEIAPLQQLDGALSVKQFRSRLNAHTAAGPRKKFKWLRIAAAMAVVSMAGLWIYSSRQTVEYLVKQTAGKIDSIVLADGTKVILAENSAIKFPDKFDAETRGISMLKGEAFFEVYKDPKHPFYIEIGRSKVSVLGTSFNIKYSSTNIDLSVKTGRVMFSPNRISKPSILIAGQALSYNFKGNTLVALNGANSNSWVTKELHFVDTPLNEVCAQIGEYYHVKIELRDRMNTVKKFNANFKNSNLDEVLRVLQETYKIQIDRSDSLIIIKTINISQSTKPKFNY